MGFFIPPPLSEEQKINSERTEHLKRQLSSINNGINDKVPEEQSKVIFDIFSSLMEPKEVFSMKADIHIEEISVALVNEKRHNMIGSASIFGFVVEFSQSNKRMLLKGMLG